ncbi:uncharacterized protein K441DRAFT_683126 [Cenococcum geophilum 1.58]|uniref:Uncharacterized protein n=1 Tax=Cenococcum geophilum 1.58 TaxID=794803 RepID=A0ACC8EKC8_9PEZI|nr:hypothetical protein K441DRAFT_683126 [Cenococcum geophilum 1.58]
MATHVATRQPFAALDTPRLQSLSNIKNRQNAIPTSFSSPGKPTQSSTGKRRYPPSSFEDDFNSENIDPSVFNSPTKRSKTSDGLSKPSQFMLTSVSQSARTSTSSISSGRISSTPAPIPSVRKALSSLNTTSSTPISLSRGSPKHKRVGLLSKRRTSSSPFRRVDPPSFTRNSSPALPFSIDAALSGTIPSYTPKSTPIPETAVPTLEETMPKSWFFDIHEDTPEQEATNLMEHSACTLDISSDDDCEKKRRNEEMERGKENIPPPDFFIAPATASANVDAPEADSSAPMPEATPQSVKLPKLRRLLAQDAMDQDRSPLSDLPAADYYGPGLDASSYVTVDAAPEKPSSLSKEFDFTVLDEPESESAAGEKTVEEVVEKEIQIYTDETASAAVPQELEQEVKVSGNVVEASEDCAPAVSVDIEDYSMAI